MNKNKKNRKGFTIVELVIVIAVIGILATVLVPTFGDVITKANESKALQAAKNAYTDLLIADADANISVTADPDGYINVGDYWYKLEAGQLTQLTASFDKSVCEDTVAAGASGYEKQTAVTLKGGAVAYLYVTKPAANGGN